MIDMHDYAQYLLRANHVPAGKEKFYVHWVSKFFEFSSHHEQRPWNQQLNLYLQFLNDKPEIQEWQIRQADQAVRTYFINFKNIQPTVPEVVLHDPPSGLSTSQIFSRFKEELQLRHYSVNTVKIYTLWVSRFYSYCHKRRSKTQGYRVDEPSSVRDFLTYLAINENVSASTQNQAFNSLLSFFRLCLNKDLGEMKECVRARQGSRLPVVFSPDEIRRLLEHTSGVTGLALRLIYGSGLRVSECCRLRVMDIDFDQNLVFVRQGKGNKDRSTVLPALLVPKLREQIARVFDLHDRDLAQGFGKVWLPDAINRKYPHAAENKAWQYLFPSRTLSVDPNSQTTRRHHMSSSSLQRAMKQAVREAKIHKHCSVHTLRHSFATHLLLSGIDIRQIQEQLGHAKVETTMIYTHVVKDMRNPVSSPLDLITS